MISNLIKLNDNVEAKQIFQLLNSNEYDVVCLFVGGCVRDLLYGKENSDIDFATSLKPNQVKKKLISSNISFDDSYEKYGSIKVFLNGKFFEINTLRNDFDQDGRQANVMFTQDWRQDALRRDFTINAIYCDLQGRVYDPFKGVDDIRNGVIKFIGNPDKKIKEDYLRALRYIRFFIQYSQIDYDEYVLNSIKKYQYNIENLSKARLIDELKKILITGLANHLFQNNYIKDLYLSVYKGIKYLTRLEFKRKKKIIKNEVDWVILLSLLLIDQTKNFERFVKDFQLSNDIKKRFNNLQLQFTFKTSEKVEKIENLKKAVPKYGVPSIIDFIHFQYLINENYDYSLYEKNLSIIKEINPPTFNFDTNILLEKGFNKDQNLGNAISFLKKRWLANNYVIRDRDIDDAIQLFK
tara:strand:- start:433 stop:1659 length:1227 start_codon:yes stop_codon:yes gene_type:complete